MKQMTKILSALCLLLSVIGAFAQQGGPAPIVRQIEIQYAGPASVSKERIIANMRTQVGKPYSESAVEEDIRSLYATGNINNVRIFGQPVSDGVKVIVVVQTKGTVGEVVIEGVTKLKVSKLRKDLLTKPDSVLNEANVEQDRQKILSEYQDKGYTDTKVATKVDTDEKTNKTRVTFTVNESGKTIIKKISFEGNESFPGKQLVKQMKTRTKNLLSFITKAGHLQNDQLDEDLNSLREFYQDHGYVDVQVQQPKIEPISNDYVQLVIPISEGTQYHVGKVSVSGAQVFSPDEVGKTLTMNSGDVFSPKGMHDDVKHIQDLYGQRGYVDLQVTPETVSAGKATISVNYHIEEGSQAYIEHINIQGNSRTKDKVIRRELAVTPGEVYDTVRVEASKKRLENLNYFSKIDAYPSDTNVAGRKDLNVLVEEKRTGSLNFGAGFSSIDNLIGFAEIQQSNFDITKPWSFTGGGQRFRARAQYGTQRKDFLIGLTEPWFLDYQLAVSGEAFYNEADYLSTEYNQRDYGFDLGARKALNNFTQVRLEYRLENIGIFNVANDAGDFIKSQQGNWIRSAITAGITHDTRDSVFLSRTGHRVDLSTFVAGGPLGGRVDVYGLDAVGSQFFHLPWDGIFILNGEVSAVNAWAGGNDVPIFDRVFLGGANNLRGFSYRKVGPKDENGEAIGGKSMARLTSEYTFPVIEKVRGALFYDAGFVNGGAFQFSPNNFSADVGFGVRLDLPIGPVRLDYGIPVKHDEWSGGSGHFNFNIGYQF
jgi:outer membrane protein insertion porin family